MKKWHDCVDKCQKSLGFYEDAKAFNVLGCAYLKLDNKKKAATAFSNALRLDPDNEEFKANWQHARKL